MLKQNLRNGDILIFRNGEEREYVSFSNISTLIGTYYNDNLECTTNDDYTIVEIKRPTYTTIFKREDKKLEDTTIIDDIIKSTVIRKRKK